MSPQIKCNCSHHGMVPMFLLFCFICPIFTSISALQETTMKISILGKYCSILNATVIFGPMYIALFQMRSHILSSRPGNSTLYAQRLIKYFMKVCSETPKLIFFFLGHSVCFKWDKICINSPVILSFLSLCSVTRSDEGEKGRNMLFSESLSPQTQKPCFLSTQFRVSQDPLELELELEFIIYQKEYLWVPMNMMSVGSISPWSVLIPYLPRIDYLMVMMSRNIFYS